MNTCDILKEIKKIAVVGISKDAEKTSRIVAKFLQDKGYEVVGVNPATPTIEGMEVYPSLKDIPFEVDLVDVFMRAERIPQIIPDVISINPKYLWLQLGIRNDEAVKPAIEANIHTVQDKCLKIEYNNCDND